MNIAKIKSYNCPVEAALNVSGGKDKALILSELICGSKRYNELH